MRIALWCALLLACASAREQSSPPAPAATATAGSPPWTTPAPAPAPKEKPPDPPPDAEGPMTAAEAAAQLAAQHGSAGDATMVSAGSAGTDGGATADEARCSSDDDCTFTRIAAGACCPMLCEPRAVTKKEAEALDANLRACSPGHPCPTPLCRAPRFSTMPACVQNRCIAKVRANEN